MSWLPQGQQSLSAAMQCIILVTVIGGARMGGGGHVIVLRLRTTVSTKIAVFCVATPCLIDRFRLIRKDRDRIVAILTSCSTLFSRRDFHFDDDLRFR